MCEIVQSDNNDMKISEDEPNEPTITVKKQGKNTM